MNIIEIYRLLPNEDACIAHLEAVRWKGKPVCPYCQSDRVTPMAKERRHHCNACHTTFSVTVGTIFHHTHLDLQKWFLAISLILNAKKGISSRQLARDLELNKNTAWYLAMRIRKAMEQSEERNLLTGIIETDEMYVGGEPRKGAGGELPKRTRGTKKTPVVGMAERGGKVKAKVMRKDRLNGKGLSPLVRSTVDLSKATLMTDEYKDYLRMSRIVDHKTITHADWYVDGDVHTNSIESFWAILNRGIVGQFRKVSVAYLPKYIDELCYRYNHRKNGDVFALTISRGLGVA
jgi:transposase-like protein